MGRVLHPLRLMNQALIRSLCVSACAVFFWTSCSNEQVGPAANEDQSRNGAKVDDVTLQNLSDLSCVVVELLDDTVLEEGLGSIYGFNETGNPMVDEDSYGVGVRTSSLSKHESGRLLSVGQTTIGLHDEDDTITVLDEDIETFDGEPTLAIEAQRAGSSFKFRLRIFEKLQLGWVFVNDKPLAKIDCRDIPEPEFF